MQPLNVAAFMFSGGFFLNITQEIIGSTHLCGRCKGAASARRGPVHGDIRAHYWQLWKQNSVLDYNPGTASGHGINPVLPSTLKQPKGPHFASRIHILLLNTYQHTQREILSCSMTEAEWWNNAFYWIIIYHFFCWMWYCCVSVMDFLSKQGLTANQQIWWRRKTNVSVITMVPLTCELRCTEKSALRWAAESADEEQSWGGRIIIYSKRCEER